MPTTNSESNASGQKPSSKKQKFNPKKFGGLVMLELAVVILFLVCLGSPLNSHLVNLLLYHPRSELYIDKEAIKLFKDRYGVELKEARFPSKNGEMLHCWYMEKPGAERTFLVSHGNAGNLSHRYLVFGTLFEANGSVFIYDYQGYGESNGEPDDKKIVEDGVAAYDFLNKKLKVKSEDIVLYGESLGCAVSSAIANERPVQAVILQSPFVTLAATAKDKVAWTKIYPDFLFVQNHLDNLSPYLKKHAPLLLIHGDKDWILKSDYSREIFAKASEPKEIIIIPEHGHNDLYPETSGTVALKIKEFLAKAGT